MYYMQVYVLVVINIYVLYGLTKAVFEYNNMCLSIENSPLKAIANGIIQIQKE